MNTNWSKPKTNILVAIQDLMSVEFQIPKKFSF